MYGRGTDLAAEVLAPDVWTGAGSRTHRLPEVIDSQAGGLSLAAAIEKVDASRLIGRDLVGLLAAAERVVSHYQALKYRVIAELDEIFDSDPQLTSAEVGAALKLTRAAADAEYLLAAGMRRHPQVHEALSKGVIDVRRAKVLVDSAIGLEWRIADRVIAQGVAEATTSTAGQLRAQMVNHRFQAEPAEAQSRYRAAVEDRRLVVSSNPDGTANLHAFDLPAEKVMAVRRHINHLARRAKVPGDMRTADQRRADTFMDLLASGTGGSTEASITLVVPADTLLGGATPAEIPGYGPILADVARQIVAQQVDGRWEYVVTDQGQPVATGTIRRQATEAMKRHVRAAKATCVFPGCRMPARDSDLDHTRPWAKHRRTRTKDLAPLCRYHHQLRHKGWTYHPFPAGDDHNWISPLGRRYTTSGRSP